MKKIFILLTGIVMLAACNNNPGSTIANFKSIDVKYPVTKKDTLVKDNYFGTEVADPYRWLENDTSAETGAWVKSENEVTENYLKQIPFREAVTPGFCPSLAIERCATALGHSPLRCLWSIIDVR